MKKFDYLFFSIICFSIIVSTVSLGLVLESNDKFENINKNFQGMVEANFNIQINNMIKSCMQDYRITINEGSSIVNAMNERTRCLSYADVAEKIYNYQQFGTEPFFSDEEIKIVEQIAYLDKFPLVERLPQTNSTD